MSTPVQQARAGRDGAGRFAPGTSGNPNGRPRGIDFRAAVVAARGEGVEAALVEVFDTLLAAALAGDVQAAKLLLDRLCGPVGEVPAAPLLLQVVTGVPE